MYSAVVLTPNPYYNTNSGQTNPNQQKENVYATFHGETAQEAANEADVYRESHLRGQKGVRILVGELTHEVKIPVKELELTKLKNG